KETPLHDGPQHHHAVAPGDFFTLRVGAWMVLNRNLADPGLFPHQLAHQFVVELKASRLDRSVEKDGTSKRLVTSFIIGKSLPVQEVRHPNNEKITDIVVEVGRLAFS